MYVCFLRILRPPRSTRTDTLFPYTTLFRTAKMVSWVATSRYSSISPQPNWSRPPARKFRVEASIGKRILGNVSPHDGARPGRKPSLRAGMARRVHALAGTFAHSRRSEEHTSELQSLMRHSYALLCLK